MRIDADCDFADLFEVKDALQKKGTYARQARAGSLLRRTERDTYRAVDGDLVVAARRRSTRTG